MFQNDQTHFQSHVGNAARRRRLIPINPSSLRRRTACQTSEKQKSRAVFLYKSVIISSQQIIDLVHA